MPSERNADEIWARCDRALVGPHPGSRHANAVLLELADRAPADPNVDRYGSGALVERLEQRVATLLGKEAAVWMPSGTMAQQIALRLHADRRGRRAVGFHPYCHLDTHEERGYEVLHGLHAVHLGSRDRLITTADVEATREPIAALLLELPQRDLGGRLPPWDDLVGTCTAARERGAAVHCDGARLWQCAPFYGRGLEEVAELFDTVYVSFYKDLGAPAGCALAGPRELIDEARVWQIRHGGRLFTTFPYLLAAERGLDEVLPHMQSLVERTAELGALLEELGVTVVPSPPQTAMLHALVRRPHGQLQDAMLDLAAESGVWFASSWRATNDPETQQAELTVTTSTFAVSLEEARELWSALLERATAQAPA
jgi:threonine aldolase